MRCNVGRYKDGSIYCCPNEIQCRIQDRYSADIFWFSGIIPPPYRIKNEEFRVETKQDYDMVGTTNNVFWRKENGWTVEMVAAVMKSAREMKQ